MFDDIDRLRTNPQLLNLLSHYAELGEPNREVWQPRLMEMEEVETPQLTKLHGELIAFGWAEQNTGHTPACYRITRDGQKAVAKAHVQIDAKEEPETEEELSQAA